MLFQLIPISIHANLLIVFLLSAYLWSRKAHDYIIFWAAAFLFITLVRDMTVLLYKRKKRKQHFFYLVNFIEMALSSLLWGLSGLIIFTTDTTANTVIIVTMLGVVVAGTSSLSSDRKMMFSFVALILIPFTVRLYLFQIEYYSVLASFLIVFNILINYIAFRNSGLVKKNIHFKVSNELMMDELEIKERRHRTIFEKAPAGIFYYDKNLIVYDCNEEFHHLMNTTRENLINFDMNDLKDKRLMGALLDPFSGKTGNYEGSYRTHFSDENLWINMTCSPLEDEDGLITRAIGIIQDRSAIHKIEEKITHMAYHDELTGLPNRLLLKDRIHQALLFSSRHNCFGAILFLDLDDFKTINDSLGHDVGDNLLIESSHRIQHLLRDEDTVSRIGGDEFVVVLPKLHATEMASMSAARLVADKIHLALSEPYELQQKSLYTSTSIGIVLFTKNNSQIDELLKHADTAMYEAKKEGRGKTHFYNIEMNRHMQKRLNMENYLRDAIDKKELYLTFQPIIDMKVHSVRGAETLLRWHNEKMGHVSPGEFIPLAEDTGLIHEIGEWLFEEVCRRIRSWMDSSSFTVDYISVNISVQQLKQVSFSFMILELLSKYNIPPQNIVLEITENIFVDDFEKVSDNMTSLKKKGVRFALDDFGTGYSSLSYLKQLKLDFIKIDRSFISDISANKLDTSLVKAVLAIGEDFEIDVIAEGVEEQDQLEMLYSIGSYYIQGYHFSKPLKEDQFIEFLKNFNI